MSKTIPARLRQLVHERAGGRCEYCLLHESHSPVAHEIDHLTARKHGGTSTEGNLGLACLTCNRRKGSDLTAIDPLTSVIVPLFNPRVHIWQEHFMLQETFIVGLTPIGRATASLLTFNAPDRIARRKALLAEGLYP